MIAMAFHMKHTLSHLVISHVYVLNFSPHYGKNLDTPLKPDLSYTWEMSAWNASYLFYIWIYKYSSFNLR